MASVNGICSCAEPSGPESGGASILPATSVLQVGRGSESESASIQKDFVVTSAVASKLILRLQKRIEITLAFLKSQSI